MVRFILMIGIIIGQVGLGHAQGDEEQYEYHVLATSRTSTMEKELNEMAHEGFRFASVMGGKTLFGGNETVVVMSKPEESASQVLYEYKLLATNRTSTMEKEMKAAGKEGYAYSGQTVFQTNFRGKEVIVIMERPIALTPVYYTYKLLPTSKTSTMHKELNEVGVEGYILKGLTVAKTMFGGPELVSILARVAQREGVEE